MSKSIKLLSFLFVITTLFVSCSDDDPIVPEPEESTIVGEWQLLKSSFITTENGEAGEPDETDYSEYSEKSVLTFSDDKKVDFKVYEKGENDELELDHLTGEYVIDGEKIKVTFDVEDGEEVPETLEGGTDEDGDKLAITFETHKIEGNTLTLTTVEGKEPVIINGTFTAKRIK